MKYDLISIGCLSFDTVVEVPFLPEVHSECFVRQIRNAHGGAAANVAAYSAFYGGLGVGLVSKIGGDEIGENLVTRMKEYGVCTKGVSKLGNSSSTRIIMIQYHEGGRSYLVHLGASEKLSIKDLPAEYLSNSVLFYVAPCTTQVHKEFIEAGVKQKKLIAFNPGSVYLQQESQSDLHQLLKFADFLFVNEQEAFCYSNKKSIDTAGFALQRLGAKHVIITHSDLGCSVFFQGKSKSFPSYNTEQVSSIGAGDAFAAGFLVEFLKTSNIESAAKMGNIFGAFRITQLESRKAAPDKKRFLKFLQRAKNAF